MSFLRILIENKLVNIGFTGSSLSVQKQLLCVASLPKLGILLNIE